MVLLLRGLAFELDHNRRTWHSVLQCQPTIERHSEPSLLTGQVRLSELLPSQIASRSSPGARGGRSLGTAASAFGSGMSATGFGTSRGGKFEILLEYPIPRVGKRIDAVLLLHDVIVAIETKTGLSATTAERQVDDYAINLACFHEPSANRTVVP